MRELTPLELTEAPRNDESGSAWAEFRLGLRSAPHLEDHRVQGVAVLPGASYIEMAARLEHALVGRIPRVLRDIAFLRPVVLTEEATTVVVRVTAHEDEYACYSFLEGDAKASEGNSRRQVATLVVERNRASTRTTPVGALSIDPEKVHTHSAIDAKHFYERLRANGNEYGPSFSRIRSIHTEREEALASLTQADRKTAGESGDVPPVVIDAMTQVLASLLIEVGRPFVWRSIGELRVIERDLPDEALVHASLGPEQPGDGDNHVGDIHLVDPSGKPYVVMSRVVLTLLDRSEASEPPTEKMVVAANFTAEPVQDAIDFWREQFGVPLHVEFAPYSQVFQELLGASSALATNRSGVNVVLLELGQWLGGGAGSNARRSLGNAEDAGAGDRARYVLPNGLEIVHLHQYETDYLYKEIFEDQCYLRHGIRLNDGDTVIDIGANIGMFSLFVLNRYPNARIFAFEPAPAVYDLLTANCARFGANARAFNAGVSDRSGRAAFTFYENSSVFSSFHSDLVEDRAAVRAVVRNMVRRSTTVDDAVDEYVDVLTADRLRGQTHECDLTTVSSIIREHGIERVHLLKIDAERSELKIIDGIGEADWQKIDQIVVEVHDRSQEALKRLEALLTSKGYRCAIERETLLAESGLYNLYATRSTVEREADVGTDRNAASTAAWSDAGELHRNVHDFAAALESFMRRSAVPMIVCVCPPASPLADDAHATRALARAEQEVIATAGHLPNVRIIPSTVPLERHGIADYYDRETDRAGHMPYTTPCYAAIGTEVFRAVYGLRTKPFKVIVLDCDNTLWQGVCGEDGRSGIRISEPYRALQQFMIDRMNAGFLLCLASKNNADDVFDIVDHRDDMLLRREHLVSWRINWEPKSANVRALAEELDLGLDSFIFLDDNPVECAEVRINCPGVLALQLPTEPAAIPRFLEHVWAFDTRDATSEDQARTRMYQENSRRRRFQAEAKSMKAFLDALELRITVSAMTDDELPRVSQLTFRTNQFNFTTVRRSEQEIREFLRRDGAGCLTIRVVDRFGDYGTVGVVLYEALTDRYRVDTFLLSCRVLGRGVEHEVLAELGRRASADGRRLVELAYRRTKKNDPVVKFLESVGVPAPTDTEASWTLDADEAAAIAYRPEEVRGSDSRPAAPPPPAAQAAAKRAGWDGDASERSGTLQRIAEQWCDAERVVEAIEAGRAASRGPVTPAPAVGTPLQGALLEIWRRVLGRSHVGLQDNFFEVGGTSLRAVQVVAAIRKELGRDVSIVSLFECPSVELLAAKLSSADHVSDGDTSVATAARRGAKRRNIVRRHTT